MMFARAACLRVKVRAAQAVRAVNDFMPAWAASRWARWGWTLGYDCFW